MMRPALTLRMGQQFALTPELKQAIRFMQLSAQELRQEVRQAAESNPLLELAEDAEDMEDADAAGGQKAGAAEADDAEEAAADEAASALAEIPDEPPVDISWDDIYPSAGSAEPGVAPIPDDRRFENRDDRAETLSGHLLWQLRLTPMPHRERLAALLLIDSIDDDGMMRAPLDALAAQMDPRLGFDERQMRIVLRRLQHFDPPGVGARDLAECLLLQLERLPAATPRREAAMRVVGEHFALLAGRDFAKLARRAKLAPEALEEALALIRSLDPRPGAAARFGGTRIDYAVPDVIATRRQGRWHVQLNADTAPRARINRRYASWIKPGNRSADNVYLRENLQQAKFVLRNIEHRNATLLRVAGEIVRRQHGFLEHGPQAMRPLLMADVAAAVERHESTISRISTRKYLATPRGVFELKFFFGGRVGADAAAQTSATAIQAFIKQITGAEDPRRPLSDRRIADALKAQRNIEVARRTVAKYREALAIPSSSERRRIGRPDALGKV